MHINNRFTAHSLNPLESDLYRRCCKTWI